MHHHQPQSLPVSHCPASAGQISTSVLACVTLPSFCLTNVNLSPCLRHTALLLSDKYQPQSLPASHCPASARQTSTSVLACAILPCFCRTKTLCTTINLSPCLCHTALLLPDKDMVHPLSTSFFACAILPCFCRQISTPVLAYSLFLTGRTFASPNIVWSICRTLLRFLIELIVR